MTERKTVLVTGATGKQGRSAIRALLHPQKTSEASGSAAEADHRHFHVLALTRNASSPAAQALLKYVGGANESDDRITLVEGSLDDRATIRKIFNDATPHGGIWGMFVVLAFPGLGKDASGEERQGKMLADLALEFQVQAFLYSSNIPIGLENESALEPSHVAKARIEDYSRKLGTKGLRWTFIRPGFFMENFDGVLGAVAATIMNAGLKEDTTLPLVASEDIGKVAAGVLRHAATPDKDKFTHKILTVTSGPVTMAQIMDSYKEATGKRMPTLPSFTGRLLLMLNAGAQNVAKQAQLAHDAISQGKYPTFSDEVNLAKSVCHLQTFYEWKSKDMSPQRREGGEEWNQVSLLKVLTGRA